MKSYDIRELFQKENGSRLVEVYGSLLNSQERNKLLANGGKMNVVSSNKRVGWVLSFDKLNKDGTPVLNLVYTKNEKHVYYTKIFETDDLAFKLIAERELGKYTLKKWLEDKKELSSYRPTILDSKIGETVAYVIPNENRNMQETTIRSNYVNTVKLGIQESFRGKEKWINHNCLLRAIEKSSKSDGVFSEFVEKAEKKYGIIDCIYNSCVIELSEKQFSQIEQNDQTRIFNPFMLRWGEMTRVLGNSGMKELVQKIISMKHMIEPFRKMNVFSCDIKPVEKEIVELFDAICYGQFKNKNEKIKNFGSTATSKILHLFCPDFFIMWDRRIRQAYMKHNEDGEDYFNFLVEMQKEFECHKNAITGLEKRFGKKPTRILDQYNYMKAQWLSD